VGKVLQLTNAVGLPIPQPGQDFDDEGTGYRFRPTYVGLLVGKKVGVLVREEPDFKDSSKTRDRVKGYCDISEVVESDVTPSGGFDPHATTTVGGSEFQSALPADDDIPF
jgi:hypothetical protein